MIDDPDDVDPAMDEASAAVITSSIEANLRKEGDVSCFHNLT